MESFWPWNGQYTLGGKYQIQEISKESKAIIEARDDDGLIKVLAEEVVRVRRIQILNTFYKWNWKSSWLDWMRGDYFQRTPPLVTKRSALPLEYLDCIIEACKYFHLAKKWWGETWEEILDSAASGSITRNVCGVIMEPKTRRTPTFIGNTVAFITWLSLTSLSFSWPESRPNLMPQN